MASSMQTSPMSDVKQPWDFARLDQQILNDKGSNHRRRVKYIQENGASVLLDFHCEGAVWHITATPATQTSSLNTPLKQATKQVVHRVEAENISPFVMDRIVDFWLQYRLDVGHVKTVSRATQMPVDTADIDVSTTQSDLDVLMDILAAAHELEDEALIDLALACVRYRVRHTLLAAKEWVEVIRRAYEMTTVKKEHDRLQKRILLNAGLYYRSPLQLPCLAKDIFKAALKARADLQDDWNHTLGWYDTTGSRQC
ncbi:hypothetical protein E8E11_008696 [Didymella keratinophila]|nr:hypothetical protein E8E11_008696 [Didymella keratinophila]